MVGARRPMHLLPESWFDQLEGAKIQIVALFRQQRIRVLEHGGNHPSWYPRTRTARSSIARIPYRCAAPAGGRMSSKFSREEPVCASGRLEWPSGRKNRISRPTNIDESPKKRICPSVNSRDRRERGRATADREKKTGARPR